MATTGADPGRMPDATEPLVSIIVVTFGTGSIVVDALDAIARFTPTAHEVIVIDNPTGDDRPTAAQVLGERSDIIVVEPDENLGFAGGNELGAERARGALLCFLNPDVIVGGGWLEPLLVALDDPLVGIAAPVFLNPNGTLQEAGQLLYDDACTAAVGGPEVMTDDPSAMFSRDVDYASAACWLVRRDEHMARGGFDTRFHPAYFEDVDYALRVEGEGKRTRLVADVPVVHHHGLGGAGQNLAMGQASQRVFRAIWAERIADRPTRPHSDDEALINRDRLAAGRRVSAVWAEGAGFEAWSDALDRTIEDAALHPRDRVTFLTGTAPPATLMHRARSAGVELLVVASRAEFERVLSVRRDRDDDVTLMIHGGRARARRVVAAAVVGIVVALGVIVRWLVLRSPSGLLTADEAYTGIQSFEILDGRFPIVLGGTAYTLPFEAYLYAPIAAFVGSNVMTLKLLSTVSWVIASVVLFMVARRTTDRRVGLVAASLCWLTPGALLIISVTAYSAYASGMAVTILALLAGGIVVDARDPRRWTMFAFGALAGFGFWLHPMFLATLVPMVLVVLWMQRQWLVTWVLVIGGGILGCLPLLAWNVKNDWPSLDAPADVEGTYVERLRTFATDLMPRAFGLRDLELHWQPDNALAPLLYLVLIALTVLGVVVLVRRPGPRSRLLLPAVLIGVFPIMAMFANLIFAADGRYGIISFPFIVLAIAVGVDALAGRTNATRTIGVFAAAGLVWIGGFVLPTVEPLVDATDGDPNAELEALVDTLGSAGIENVYGSYWAVLPVDFVGDQELTGGVFTFWPIRFPERQRGVEATPIDQIAIVYLITDEDPSRLPLPVDDYERRVFGDFVLYLPIAAATAD